MTGDIDILTLGLYEAWNMFKIMANNTPEYENARYGIKLKFDINDYIKGRLSISLKQKSGKAIIHGRSYPLIDFDTELEQREKMIKLWLVENYTEDDIARPRGNI